MNNCIDSDGAGGARMYSLCPRVPIRVAQGKIIRGGAVGPLSVCRAEKVREPGFLRAVVNALAAATGYANPGGDLVHAISVAAGDAGAGPDGGGAATQRGRDGGEA